MHGRVSSLVQIANACSLPLGIVLFGPLADRVSIGHLLVCSGVPVLLCGSWALASKRFVELK